METEQCVVAFNFCVVQSTGLAGAKQKQKRLPLRLLLLSYVILAISECGPCDALVKLWLHRCGHRHYRLARSVPLGHKQLSMPLDAKVGLGQHDEQVSQNSKLAHTKAVAPTVGACLLRSI
jgi:hypothetical protein